MFQIRHIIFTIVMKDLFNNVQKRNDKFLTGFLILFHTFEGIHLNTLIDAKDDFRFDPALPRDFWFWTNKP